MTQGNKAVIMNPSTIRVMLVEDNIDYREVVTLAIAEQDDMTVSSQFGTTEIALQHLEETTASQHPDILLLDLRLPGMSGLAAIPLFRTAAPATRIIVLSQSNDPRDITQAISAGVSGYMLKQASLSELADGIRTVARGGASLDKDVARHILETIQRPLIAREELLSGREQEVLELLAEGLAKKEIATHLDLSYSTVDSHVTHIYEKLDVRNAPAAVSKAFRSGLLG